jgi:ethanolamine kinase
LGEFAKELAWLQTVLPSPLNQEGGALGQDRASKLAFARVFCHNDLLSGNILFLAKESRVQLIDFEYGGYNYRAFDMANHFCEHAGFGFELEKWWPAAPVRRHFYRAYLRALGEPELDDAGLLVLDGWTCKMALCANAMWFLWAVLQAKHSVIDVDFLDYARKRRAGFFLQKKMFFGL